MLLGRFRISPIVAFILLGLGLRVVVDAVQYEGAELEEILEFMGRLGVIVLLFRVGLETRIAQLLRELDRALWLWLADVSISATIGFVAAHYVLGLDLIPSFFVATALPATSVAVSLAVWQQAGMASSKNGALLLDVAELDDLSGVFCMTLLFSLAPLLHEGNNGSLASEAIRSVGWLFVKLVAFAGFCLLISRFVEARVTRLIGRARVQPDPMLVVLGVGIVVAGISDYLGFSSAVGALFAGLIFSRDPKSVKIEASFDSIYELFSPFFFIAIGFQITPSALLSSPWAALVLLVAAVVGKVTANGLPLLLRNGVPTAALIGVSMVPRAEIAMIVMQQGLHLGDWAVSPQVFAPMVTVTLVTCFAVPLLLGPMLNRWPQEQE